MSDPLLKNGFYNPSVGSATFGKIIDEIINFISEDENKFYSVIVGSDSQVKIDKKIKSCDFVTVVIVHRIGSGARYFWKKENITKVPVLWERIYFETTRSIETANIIVPELRNRIGKSRYNFEIHVDIGPNGKTREMIKEIVGMINGYGYTAKTKPESWGASSVADRHT